VNDTQIVFLIVAVWLAISAALLSVCCVVQAFRILRLTPRSIRRRPRGSFTRPFSAALSSANPTMVERVRTYTGCRPGGAVWVDGDGREVRLGLSSSTGHGSSTAATGATSPGAGMTAAADDHVPRRRLKYFTHAAARWHEGAEVARLDHRGRLIEDETDPAGWRRRRWIRQAGDGEVWDIESTQVDPPPPAT